MFRTIDDLLAARHVKEILNVVVSGHDEGVPVYQKDLYESIKGVGSKRSNILRTMNSLVSMGLVIRERVDEEENLALLKPGQWLDIDKLSLSFRLYTLIKSAALKLMEGDELGTERWLSTPLRVFSYKTPLEHAMAQKSADEVIDLINRIEHGVFS